MTIKEGRLTERMANKQEYNTWVRDQWLGMWVRNSGRTYHEVEKKFEEKNCDLLTVPNEKKPVLCLGSGPSLDDWHGIIKDWEGDIYCSTSQLSWLEAQGVDPTMVFLLDADPAMTYLISDYNSSGSKTIFLTHPSIQREAIQAWDGDMRFFRMFDPGDEFFANYLKMMYIEINEKEKWGINVHILNSGCVMNTMMAVAQLLGRSPIFTAGYDLGFPGKQYRYLNYNKVDGEWVRELESPLPDKAREVAHNGVLTDQVCIFYKYSSMMMWGLQHIPLLSTSKGIFDEAPCLKAVDVLAAQGQGFEDKIMSDEDAYLLCQEYLAYRGIYIRKTGTHYEVSDPLNKGILKKVVFHINWALNHKRVDWEAQATRARVKHERLTAEHRLKLERRGKWMGYSEKAIAGIKHNYSVMEQDDKFPTAKSRYKEMVRQMIFAKKHNAGTIGAVLSTAPMEIITTAATASQGDFK